MKLVLYIPTAHTENNRPSPWLKARLDAAIGYYQNQTKDDCVFVISGRWPNLNDVYDLTESEISRRYVLEQLPSAKIIKEDICVETAGGFAFAKPIIDQVKPTKVVIFNSVVNGERIKYLANKIFGSGYEYEFVLLDDELSRNPKAIDKEPRALVMFKKLLDGIKDGNAAAAQEILLYKTPFYFKNLVDDEKFFNEYWPGGWENKKFSEDSKQGK